MPNKMERFNQRGRRVLSLAQEEAERLQHNYIGTEHLLLGLMREEGGIAGRVLRDLGLDSRRVEDLVERMTRATTRSTHSSSAQLDLSPGTKRVLELAVDEARRMGHHYIGTEHLLLGLVRQSEGVAIDVLKRLGVSPEEVRRQTRRVLQGTPVQSIPPTPAEPELQASRSTFFVEEERRKVLQTVDAGKIIAEQGVELLKALGDINNQIHGRLLVLRDITEEKLLEAYHDEITNMAIHELRGPLASIINHLALARELVLKKGDQQASAERMLGLALESAQRLIELVDSMMNKARQVPLQLEAISLRQLVENAFMALAYSIQEARVNVLFDLPTDLPLVYVDGDKIRRVIINLLDNAVRHSPKGGDILIEASLLPKEQRILVRIANSGPGIPLGERELSTLYVPAAVVPPPTELDQRKLHLTISDKATGAAKFDLQIPYLQAHPALLSLTLALYTGQIITVFSGDEGDDHIELKLE